MYLSTETNLRSVILPQQTDTYKPVSHSQLIDLIGESVDKAGFKISNALYTSAMDGQIANARYRIENVKDSEMGLEIGWQNSYNKSLTLKFAIGATVFICKNGMVRGDMGTLKRKHTGDVQQLTPLVITESIKAAGDKFKLMQDEREMLKTIEIDTRIAAELVGRMIVEEHIISSTQLNTIKSELRKPSFNYNADRSLWELYQHTTYSMSDIHPRLWMSNHMKAHEFFMGYYNDVTQMKTEKVIIPVEELVVSSENVNTYGVDPERQLSLFDQLAE